MGAPLMGFSGALQALHLGALVERAGWHKRFLYLVPGSSFNVSRPPLCGIYPEGHAVTYRPHIDVRNPDGSHSIWTPTHDDLLALDWREHLDWAERADRAAAGWTGVELALFKAREAL